MDGARHVGGIFAGILTCLSGVINNETMPISMARQSCPHSGKESRIMPGLKNSPREIKERMQ